MSQAPHHFRSSEMQGTCDGFKICLIYSSSPTVQYDNFIFLYFECLLNGDVHAYESMLPFFVTNLPLQKEKRKRKKKEKGRTKKKKERASERERERERERETGRQTDRQTERGINYYPCSWLRYCKLIKSRNVPCSHRQLFVFFHLYLCLSSEAWTRLTPPSTRHYLRL